MSENPNDLVQRSLGFIFDHDVKSMNARLIELLEAHRQVYAGAQAQDIMNIALVYAGHPAWTHPNRGRQARGMAPLVTVKVQPEWEPAAKAFFDDMQLLDKDTKRARKTLTQLVRGMQTDQDLRDSLPDRLCIKLGLAHLSRTREPAFRYATLDPRVYENIQKDIEMIEGYLNGELFF